MIETERKYIQVDKPDWDSSNEYATKLHLAVKDNNLRYVQILIGDGVHMQSMDKFGRTPLHWALVFGYQKVACALIINTPNSGLDYKDNFGCTPLHYAALGGRTDVGRILLERGALIDSIDSKQRTPLHYAARNARPDMVEMLVSRGANKNCLDCKGFIPCDIALEWGSFSSLICLRQNDIFGSVKTSELNDPQNVDCSKVGIQAQQHESMSENKDLVEAGPFALERKRPSLDKLMLAWKNIQNNAKKKRDLEAQWIAEASIMLEDKLGQWRVAEQDAKQRKHEGWSLFPNIPSTHNLWKIESSNATRLLQQIHRNRTSQFNCWESTSNYEASTQPQDHINPLFLSPSTTFYSLPSSSFYNPPDFTLPPPLSAPDPNETLYSNVLNPKLNNSAPVHIGTFGLSTPLMEVGQAISNHDQVTGHDSKSVYGTTICSSSNVVPQSSSTSLTTSTSPNLAMLTRDDVSKHDRFWWCKGSNSSKQLSTIQQLEEEASTIVGDKTNDLRWCTEWELGIHEISIITREAAHGHKEMQGLSPLNACDKSCPIDKGKEKAKAFFEEEPMWVQVWPKPTSSSSSSFSSRSKTMTSM